MKAKLLIVLTGAVGSGGAYHQTNSTLQSLLVGLQDAFDIRVVDIDLGFTSLLDRLVEERKLTFSSIVTFERSPRKWRDRIRSSRGRLWAFLRVLLSRPYVHWFAYQIDRADDDLVYFASQSELAARVSKPYVWTLWDICHIDSPEFDEVRASGEFERRDRSIWTSIRKAALVVVDSPKSVKAASHAFGVPETKLVFIPFSPAPHIAYGELKGKANEPSVDSVEKLPAPYFYYPAQFWGAKNHIRILDALSILVERGFEGGVVFSGNDRGSLDRVRRNVVQKGLEERVRILTYVSDREVRELFRGSVGLVMASYFGPTNIPPLEAMSLGVPVVASRVHEEQLGDAALLFDPDSQTDLAEKLELLLEPHLRDTLVARGQEHIQRLNLLRNTQQSVLREQMIRIAKRITDLQWREI